MDKINSFDVFDTIIGRLCYKGTEIFKIIEITENIENFQYNRINCESSTLNETYNKLQSIYTSHNMDNIKKKELQLEYDFSFPIWKYLNMIDINDILISDMYLDNNTIMGLINKHKLIDNKLYVSPSHKASGIIYKNKELMRNINIHTGDNYTSDYLNAINNGINAQWINNIDLTANEILLQSVSKELAYITRAVRLTTQKENLFNKVFTNIVLPLGILICVYIKQQKKDNIIFLSRDGYWLHEIYIILFGNNNVHYKYFSRLMMNSDIEQNKFIKDLNDISGSKMVIDLVGTGGTFSKIINKMNNCFYTLVYNYNLFNIYKNMSSINTSILSSSMILYLEDMFSAPHGSINIDGTLLDPEYDINILHPYVECLELFKNYKKIYNKYITENVDFNIDTRTLINKILNTNEDYIIDIKNHINHVNNHDSEYKKYKLEYYSQIEQDKYYIENVCKFKLCGTFLDIGAYDGIVGSNTYFLEKNLGWKGILCEANPNIISELKRNRKGIICDKAIYRESGKYVDFIIPNGNNLKDGAMQLAGISEYIKQESKDHFKEQYNIHKIEKVETININELLHLHKYYLIDYMSLDIEGYELELLNSLDFNTFKIKYITVEHGCVHEYKDSIKQFLENNNYKLVRNNKWDDEYILIE